MSAFKVGILGRKRQETERVAGKARGTQEKVECGWKRKEEGCGWGVS